MWLLTSEEFTSYMFSACGFHLSPERQRKLGQEVLAKEGPRTAFKSQLFVRLAGVNNSYGQKDFWNEWKSVQIINKLPLRPHRKTAFCDKYGSSSYLFLSAVERRISSRDW